MDTYTNIPLQKSNIGSPPRVCVIGCSGSGKTSLCNSITRGSFSKNINRFEQFNENHRLLDPSNIMTNYKLLRWFGNYNESQDMFIDTPGFKESNKESAESLVSIARTLRELKQIDCFILVMKFNSRFYDYLQNILKSFNSTFPNLQDNLMVVFTYWEHNPSFERKNRITKVDKTKDIQNEILSAFKIDKNIPCAFIDNTLTYSLHQEDPQAYSQNCEEIEKIIRFTELRTKSLNTSDLFWFGQVHQDIIEMRVYEKRMNEFITNINDEDCLFVTLDNIGQHFNMNDQSYHAITSQEYRLKIKTEIEKKLDNYVNNYKKKHLPLKLQIYFNLLDQTKAFDFGKVTLNPQQSSMLQVLSALVISAIFGGFLAKFYFTLTVNKEQLINKNEVRQGNQLSIAGTAILFGLVSYAISNTKSNQVMKSTVNEIYEQLRDKAKDEFIESCMNEYLLCVQQFRLE